MNRFTVEPGSSYRIYYFTQEPRRPQGSVLKCLRAIKSKIF